MRSFWTRLLDIRHHIAARIFVSVFVCLYAVMVIFLLVFFSMNRQQTKRTMEQTAEAMLDKSHAQIQLTMQEVEELCAFLLSDQNVSEYLYGPQEFPPTIAWFGRYNDTLSLMRNYIVGRSRTIVGMGILKDGGERCYTGTLYAPVYSEVVPQANGLVISPTYPYVQRVVALERDRHAVIITQLAQDFWSQMYGPNLLEQHVVAAFDPGGGLVYASPGYAALEEDVRQSMLQAARRHGQPGGSGGHLLVSSHEPATGLTAVAWVPERVINESLVPFNRQQGALLVILFFTAILLSHLLSLGITRNIGILRRNAEKIGQGRYEEMQPVISEDELGQLGQTMQEMAARIALLIEDVNQREQRKREMELEILRAQVSPHFLYNALNTISYLSALQGIDNIGQFSASLIDLLQAALKPTDFLISIEQEISYVRSYHEIMRYRYVHEVRLGIDIAPAVHGVRVIRMLLQPIVENALIHGIGPQQDDGLIHIAMDARGDMLCIDVTDNGAGMTREQIDAALSQQENKSPLRFSGIGIRNVRDRLRLQFGEPYGLTISSVPGVYTKVSLCMPLLREEDAHEDSAG